MKTCPVNGIAVLRLNSWPEKLSEGIQITEGQTFRKDDIARARGPPT